MSSHGSSPIGSAWTMTPLVDSVTPVRRSLMGGDSRLTSSSAAIHASVTGSPGSAASR